MSETVPGIRDVVTTGKLYHEVRSGNWDLVVADGPRAAQVPFLLADDGASADLHLMRSNPVARAAGPASARTSGFPFCSARSA